jgi:hypothetical protein
VTPASATTARTDSESRSSRSKRSGLWEVTNSWVRRAASRVASIRMPTAAGCRATSGSSMPISGGACPFASGIRRLGH